MNNLSVEEKPLILPCLLLLAAFLAGCRFEADKTSRAEAADTAMPADSIGEILQAKNLAMVSPLNENEASILRKFSERGRLPAAGNLRIDYPRDSSVFPPEIVAPTLVWRNEGLAAQRWLIEIDLGDSAKLSVLKPSQGPPPMVIDRDVPLRAGSDTISRPKSMEVWTLPNPIWAELRRKTVETFARVTISGFASGSGGPVLQGGFVFAVSKDSVAAPIFYRDVPFIPVVNEKDDNIFPLQQFNMRFINWRLRDVSRWESKIVLRDMPTCSNCHTFSRDGKWMGMDIDGPQSDKGAYGIQKVSRQMVFDRKHVMSWNYDYKGRTPGKFTLGFMSSMAPDGRNVVSTVNEELYSVGFKDPAFSQVFYPTRGILAYYSQSTKKVLALPGADDTAYVQCSPTWTPDGKYIVFSRAKSKPPYTKNQRLPAQANDPEETQIKYDLYRIPFNDGKGGKAEPIPGASSNGMSNSFAKVTPDGKFIIWVQAKNGLLMRPGSKLWIVPIDGGQPRLMTCNGDVMNSWHSISPNGRWMVFSSKHFTGYTQLFLTHLDGKGGDSPMILIPNSTADNRASNIPEFAPIGYDDMVNIDVPAVSHFRYKLQAQEMLQNGRYEEAIALMRKALKDENVDMLMRSDMMVTLGELTRDNQEAIRLLKETIKVDSTYHQIYFFLGHFYELEGQERLAIASYRKCLAKNPQNYWAMLKLVQIYMAPADSSLRHIDSALYYGTKACDLTYYQKSYPIQNLARVFSEQGRFAEAAKMAELGIMRAGQINDTGHIAGIKNEMRAYAMNRTFTSLIHWLPQPARK